MKEFIPTLPKDFYRKGEGQPGDAALELAMDKPNHKLTAMNFEDGVHIYVENGLYPKTVFPTPQAIYSIDIVKKMFIEFVHIMSRWQFIPSFILIALRPKTFLSHLLRSWTRIAKGAMDEVFIADKYQTEFTKHVKMLVEHAVIRAGFDKSYADITGDVVAHIFYYDSAYFNRFIDIANEVSQLGLILDLDKEIKRLIGIFMQRETNPSIRLKFKRIFRVFNLLMKTSWFKKMIKEMIREADFRILRGTEGDIYWMNMFEDYLYMGLTLEERIENMKALGLLLPTLYRFNRETNTHEPI